MVIIERRLFWNAAFIRPSETVVLGGLMFDFFLGRPKGGLMFYQWCIFFFVSPLVIRAPSTDCPESLPHGRNLAEFYNPLQKFEVAPPKNLGAKNMQNFGQFWTTSDFDREYLQKCWRYPKSAGVTNYDTSSCFNEKSRELWSTNGLEFHVSLDPLKMHFFGILYLEP